MKNVHTSKAFYFKICNVRSYAMLQVWYIELDNVIVMWLDLGKTCIVHTSNFSTLVTHKISLEWQIDVKLSGIVEPLFLHHPWMYQIFIPFHVVFMDLQMFKIRCVNYARFPISSHILSFTMINEIEEIFGIIIRSITQY